jgi:hypothetical protein
VLCVPAIAIKEIGFAQKNTLFIIDTKPGLAHASKAYGEYRRASF